jgi:hypothetical protein
MLCFSSIPACAGIEEVKVMFVINNTAVLFYVNTIVVFFIQAIKNPPKPGD